MRSRRTNWRIFSTLPTRSLDTSGMPDAVADLVDRRIDAVVLGFGAQGPELDLRFGEVQQHLRITQDREVDGRLADVLRTVALELAAHIAFARIGEAGECRRIGEIEVVRLLPLLRIVIVFQRLTIILLIVRITLVGIEDHLHLAAARINRNGVARDEDRGPEPRVAVLFGSVGSYSGDSSIRLPSMHSKVSKSVWVG